MPLHFDPDMVERAWNACKAVDGSRYSPEKLRVFLNGYVDQNPDQGSFTLKKATFASRLSRGRLRTETNKKEVALLKKALCTELNLIAKEKGANVDEPAHLDDDSSHFSPDEVEVPRYSDDSTGSHSTATSQSDEANSVATPDQNDRSVARDDEEVQEEVPKIDRRSSNTSSDEEYSDKFHLQWWRHVLLYIAVAMASVAILANALDQLLDALGFDISEDRPGVFLISACAFAFIADRVTSDRLVPRYSCMAIAIVSAASMWGAFMAFQLATALEFDNQGAPIDKTGLDVAETFLKEFIRLMLVGTIGFLVYIIVAPGKTSGVPVGFRTLPCVLGVALVLIATEVDLAAQIIERIADNSSND